MKVNPGSLTASANVWLLTERPATYDRINIINKILYFTLENSNIFLKKFL